MYDLIPYHEPHVYLNNKESYKTYSESLHDLLKADGVLCISRFTQLDYEQVFPEMRERTHFLGGGPSANLHQVATAKAKQIITILGDDSRKNVEGLLKAWQFLSQNIKNEFSLKIVGAFSPERIEMLTKNLKSIQGDESKISFLGVLSDHELELELCKSLALIHPAKSEGLGMPVLEAISLGLPALCSNTTSMIEIGGRGAILEPDNPENMAVHIQKILEDEEFRLSIKQDQSKTLEIYNWGSVINRFLSVMNENRSRSVPNGEDKLLYCMLGPGLTSKTGVANFAAKSFQLLKDLENFDFYATEELDNFDESIAMLSKYDIIVIHLGNSPHHKNAFKIAAALPAFLILHDTKLGNTIHELNLSDPEWMPEFDDILDAAEEVKHVLSMKRILNLALGVVVHSETAKNFLYDCKFPSSQIKTCQLPSMIDDVQLQKISKDTPFFSSKIISGGFINPTKMADLIIKAISRVNNLLGITLSLELVGEVEDNYASLLKSLAKELRVPFEISGYLPFEDHLKHILQGVMAIQLRSMDSGEGSAVVVDLMKMGKSVIVNDFGPFKSLPKNVAHKIPAYPSVDELVDAIISLLEPEYRIAIENSSRTYSKEVISPQNWCHGLLEFIQNIWFHEPFAYLVNSGKFDTEGHELFKMSLDLMKSSNTEFGLKKIIASDITNMKNTEFISGIQRVTNEVHSAIQILSDSKNIILRGIDFNNGIGSDNSKSKSLFSVQLPLELQNIANADVIVLLDLNFNITKIGDLEEAKKHGIPIIVNLYDLLPLSNPEWFPPGTFEKYFEPWLKTVIKNATDIIVNSQTTLDFFNTTTYASKFSGELHVVPLGNFFGGRRLNLERIANQTLIVGTIEPRKGHDDVLDAFENIAKDKSDATLYIVGRQGWMVENLIERLQNHSLFNKRIFWLANCDDETLIRLYNNSSLTIIASRGEGFGLPVIEALDSECPVLVRNLPVFREIAGEYAIYFENDVRDLTEKWSHILEHKIESLKPNNVNNFGYEYYATYLTTLIQKRLNFK